MNVFCLLTNLVPPPIHFSTFSIQLPVSKILCPKVNPDKDILFYVYTKSNKDDGIRIKLDDDNLLMKSGIDFKKKTVIFLHGFMQSYKSDVAQIIKNSYLEAEDVNVILVNAERLLVGFNYLSARLNVEPIGKYCAKFIDYLVSKGLKLSDLHIIGMSLGGQISGIIGSSISNGKPNRITGLEPAGPLFQFSSEKKRLDKTDADFVDVIHSNAGIFGYSKPCGHLDVWLNGGTFQPGCRIYQILLRSPLSLNVYIFCNHNRAYQTFAESITHPKEFPAVQCDSYRDFKTGKCSNNEKIFMGEYVNETACGNFYISTPAKASYI